MAEKKRFLLSDDSTNMYGFRLDMAKLDLSRFSKNPVMFYNHKELVGKWENLQIEDGKLYGTPVFMDSENEPEAKRVAERVDLGFVNGASLGIDPTKVTYFEDESPLVEAEVLECSVCDLPANGNAIRVLSKDGAELTLEEITKTLSALAVNENPKILNLNTTMKLNAQAQIALGLSDGADDTAINAAVIALKAKADEAIQLQAKVDQMEADRQAAVDAEIKTMLQVAKAEGRILATEEPHYEALAKADLNLCKTTIAKLPVKTNLNVIGENGGKNLSEIPEERKAWTRLEWAKNDTPGLLSIKENNPELYAEISKR